MEKTNPIKKVLALFDTDDIKYIKSVSFINYYLKDKSTFEEKKPKCKKMGDIK